MIMCVLLCYPVSIHMSQLQATGRPISSSLLFSSTNLFYVTMLTRKHFVLLKKQFGTKIKKLKVWRVEMSS